jgi:hypothetical protein
MDPKRFSSIIERAKSDPEYLHKLLFEPETLVADKEGHLTRTEIGAAMSRTPSELIARAIGVLEACGNTCTSSCDNTCGQSCGFTTNLTDEVAQRVSYFSRASDALEGCGNTCTSSCDNTCGQSCGFTTNLTDFASFAGRQQYFR